MSVFSGTKQTGTENSSKLVSGPQETRQLAANFSQLLRPGDVVAFYGDLGSGKTLFSKALCESLGSIYPATSPSFTIINEYPASGGLTIYHFDFYRLEQEGELLNLGLDDFFYSDNICLIEWADKIEKYLPFPRWEIRIDFVEHRPEARKITITRKD